MSILVLGLGNILLSDEGVGVRIVEALDAAHELPAEVEVLDGGTSGMDLLDMVAERDCLIVADAINADQPAGNVIRLEDDDIRMLFETRFSPHQLGLSDMLAALRLVGKAPRRVIVVGVVPQNLSLGMELSPPVTQGRDAALGVIVDELTRLGAAPRPRLHRGAPAHVPAKWIPVRRQEHAPMKESRACSDSTGTEHARGAKGWWHVSRPSPGRIASEDSAQR